MDKLYQRINYENSPSKKTPLSEANLNKMDKALDDLDNRIIEQDAAFAKSIEEEGKKIEETNKKVSDLASVTEDYNQSKADAITVEKSGITITATDSSDKGFEQFRTFGKSVQEKTSGKQLFDVNAVNSGTGTVSIEDNGYTMEVTGSAPWAQSKAFTIYGTAGTQYTISANNITCGNNGGIYIQNGAGSTITTLKTTGAVTFTIPDGETSVLFKFVANNSNTELSSAVTARFEGIMINEGSEALPWEPYTGNIPSPNPEYPQPIVGAGQMLAKGKNLVKSFDINTSPNAYATVLCVDADLKPLTTYTISFKGTNGNRLYLNEYISDYQHFTVTGGINSITFTTLESISKSDTNDYDTNKGMWKICKNESNGNPNTFDELMINEGSEALPYEPYTGEIETVYETGISNKVLGSQLFDKDNPSYRYLAIDANEFIYSEQRTYYIKVKPSTTYTISKTVGAYLRVCTCEKIPAFGGKVTSRNENTASNIVTITTGKNDNYLAFYPRSVSEKDTVLFADILKTVMINEGSKALPYEPYTEQTHTSNRVLNGIPLGQTIPDTIKSSPAHMDGVYWDDETQQYYIGDTEDGVNGVYVQMVKRGLLPKDNWAVEHSGEGKDFVEINRNISSVGLVQGTAIPLLCTICTKTELSRIVYVYNHFYFKLQKSDTITSADDALEFVANNDIEYFGILATPIETPLTDAEIAAYKALHSNKPTTVITNDAGCYMEVEYVADPKNHIEQNYVPVSKYAALEERVSVLEQLHV